MKKPKKFDSPEEEAFWHWCLEAKQIGIIDKFEYQPQSIEIIPAKYYIEEKQLKTKIKETKRPLCQSLSYTADFKIYGKMHKFHRPKKHMLCVCCSSLLVVSSLCLFLIDVKGNYKDGNKASKFNLIQKVLYHVKGIYVNRLIPSEFFKIAWVPDYNDSVFDNNFCYTKARNFAKKGYQPPVVRSNLKDAKTLNEWKELNL